MLLYICLCVELCSITKEIALRLKKEKKDIVFVWIQTFIIYIVHLIWKQKWKKEINIYMCIVRSWSGYDLIT